MSSPPLEYPALYEGASDGSARAQSAFLWTIRAEFFLLFCVSVAGATRDFWANSEIVISLMLLVLAGLLVFKTWNKLDQNWYRCRALAESIKTSTWRLSMRAHPFDDADQVSIPKAKFRNVLRDILEANRHIAQSLTAAESQQVTESMLAIRRLPVKERLAFYVEHRIDDQRRWYARKSSANRDAQRVWVAVIIVVYVVAVACVSAGRIGLPWLTNAFDPLIVLATSAIGWLQIKRHGELTASYNLTAHEIGIIRSNSDDVDTEDQLSEFVNEAELAFSREHTQWVARRDAV